MLAAFALIDRIPKWLWAALLFVAVTCIALGGVYTQTKYRYQQEGKLALQKQQDAYDAERRIEAQARKTALLLQKQESDKLLSQQAETIREIAARKEKTITIIKRVKEYVTQKSDAGCTIPRGFVWLHNATLAPELGIPPGESGDVDAPTAVKLSAVAEVVGQNNAECVARGALIKEWQDWYKASKTIFENAKQIDAPIDPG